MNGRDLTLGLVGALALGGIVGRRGSASATEVAAVLPEPSAPPPGMKPRWASSWTKGKAWARTQLLQHPSTYDPRDALAVLDAADRKVVEDNTLGLPSLDRLEGKLRGGLIDRVRPKVLAEAARLRGVADRKSRGAASVDERAFWTGVGDYTAEVLGAATDADGMARAEALLDAVEANLVRAWMRRKREGSAARTPGYVEISSDLFRESGYNATDFDQVDRYAASMKRAGGWGRFPPISGQIGTVDEADLQNYRDAEEGGFEHELAWSRPLTDADLGRDYVSIEDGHHRAHAARKNRIPIRVKPFTWGKGPWTAAEIRRYREENP